MAQSERVLDMPRLMTLAAVAVVTLSLYLAKDVLMPLALGILFSFLLAPLVTRVERLGAHRIVAVTLVTTLTFAAVGATTYFVVKQLFSLAEALPQYRQNIHERVQDLRKPSPISKAAKSIEVIRQELATTQPASASAPANELPARPAAPALEAPAPRAQPVPVTIVDTNPKPFFSATDTLGWVIGPLGQAAIVVIFVIFMLIQREDLRDRLIYLLGRGHIHLTTQAIDDASRRISRYLFMQLIVNVTYGVPVAIGLWLLDVPNALVWGLLATLLRYLPYVGPWIAASLPVILSLAISTGWWQPLAVIGLFVTLELISNNFLEPWLYGSSTGMSSVAVLVAAVFWGWLWGPVGLLLATPMTVCLVVAGKYVPQLEFLHVLLGDEPVWDGGNRFYQRLLAQDLDEANDVVEEYLRANSLIAVYDDIVLPALHLAERDRHRGDLNPEQEEFVRGAIEEFVADLEEAPLFESAAAEGAAGKTSEAGDTADARASTQPLTDLTPPAANRPHVLCLPARDAADELAARMLAQVLRKAGYSSEATSTESLASETIEHVTTSKAQIVCVSALPPAAIAHSRYLCKRLRSRFDRIKLLIGLWNANGDLSRAREKLTCIGGDKVVRTIREALEQVENFNLLGPEEAPAPLVAR